MCPESICSKRHCIAAQDCACRPAGLPACLHCMLSLSYCAAASLSVSLPSDLATIHPGTLHPAIQRSIRTCRPSIVYERRIVLAGLDGWLAVYGTRWCFHSVIAILAGRPERLQRPPKQIFTKEIKAEFTMQARPPLTSVHREKRDRERAAQAWSSRESACADSFKHRSSHMLPRTHKIEFYDRSGIMPKSESE